MRGKRISLIISLTLIITILAFTVPAKHISAATSLYISNTTGPTGSTVYIEGTGFTANINSILFGPAYQLISSPILVTGTNFAYYFTVPAMPRNNYAITVSDGVPADTKAINFMITPTISSNASSGEVNSQVAINGTGFNASANVWVYLDSTSIAGTVSDTSGTISNFTFNIPETFAGMHTIAGYDTLGYSPTIPFTVTPAFSVDKTTAVPGTSINVSGKGFAASAPITFTLDDIGMNISASTNTVGTLASTSFNFPAVSAGDHVLKVTDALGNFKTATITTASTLTISPTRGKVGSQVTLTGVGFGAQKVIAIKYNGTLVNTTPSTISDTTGKFTATITVPNGASGTYIISATDGVGTATANFTSSAIAAPTGTTTGGVGDSIPIAGQGFNAGATVNIKFDNIAMANTTSDASGSFSINFPLPTTTGGAHNIIATDGVNSVTFQVNVTPKASALSVTQGFIGSSATLSGTSFAAGKTADIKFDSTSVATANIDATGSFSVTFQVPKANSGAHTVTLSDGITTKTYTFTLQAAAPAAPALASPLKDTKAEKPVSFQWNSVSSQNGTVTYELQVASDATFNMIVLDKKNLTTTNYTLAETEILKNVNSKNPYYWRIQATDGAGDKSPWSNASTFTVGIVFPTWLMWFIVGVGGVLLFGLGFFLGRRMKDFGINR